MRHRLFIPAATALLFALAACTQDELAEAGNNYTYTVKVRNKVLEVSEATIAKWNDINGGEVDAGL